MVEMPEIAGIAEAACETPQRPSREVPHEAHGTVQAVSQRVQLVGIEAQMVELGSVCTKRMWWQHI